MAIDWGKVEEENGSKFKNYAPTGNYKVKCVDVDIKLLMSFMTDSDRKVSLYVTDPREDVTESEIKEVMDLIVEKNIFAPNGEAIVSAKEAKIVQTETTEFDFVVA